MHRYLRSIIAKLVVMMAIAVAGSEALAQGVTGSAVTGTVTGEEGKPIQDATVQLRNPATGQTFSATTGASGEYFLDNVPPGGPYILTATAAGFQTTTQEGIQLTLGERLKIDLVVKSFGEEISVVAHLDALADRARTGPSTTVKESTIKRLPLQGRNFTNLISTDPRVTVTGSSVSIAGQNFKLNNIQIDGGANNDLFGLADNGTPGGQANAKPLSIEAIREFTVQVAPFDVRLGNFAGGLVNAITKSGTNDFHGSLFGYFQNKSLANQRAFIRGEYITDPNFLDYNVWQFGLAVGGPIVKDKAHFFVATDIQQRHSAFGSPYNMIGDLAYDTTHAGFDTTTVDRFNTILAKYGIVNAGDYRAPTLGNPDRNVFAKVTTSVIEDSDLELSYNFVNARQDQLIRNPISPFVPNSLRDGYELSNSGYGQANTTNTFRGKLTSNLNGGKLSNEFLASVSFIRDARDLPLNAPLILVRAGTLNAAPAWLAAGAERFSQANALDQDIYQIQDNLSFPLDNHRFVVGTTNEFLKIRNVFLQAATGVWAFDSLAAFDAGTPIAFQRRFGVRLDLQDPGTAKFNAVQLGFYVQDEWSLFKNLTLTPGFRVDVPILSHANANQVVLNSPTLPIDTSKVPSGNPLWSPRLGFNWDVDGSSDTIVRGGVGVFSGRPAYVWVSNAYSINGLSQVQLTCFGATGVPAFTPDPRAQPSDCAGGTGTPPAPANQGEIDYFDANTKYPQNLRLALGVDRRLPLGIVGSVDLLYTRDINGWYVTDENLQVVGTSGEGRTLYGTFNAVTGRSTPTRVDGTNLTQAVKVFNKNGGHVGTATVQVQKQIGQRYALAMGYTYSRSYDRISLTSSQALSNFQFAPIDGDIQSRAVRPSAFDRPHKITVTGTANLPYGFGLGLSYIGQSGLPYTWVVAGDANGDGLGSNDLVYVPASASDITLKDPTGVRTPAEMYTAMSAFIDSQDCLREARGGLIKRGACRNPWVHFVDLRLTWTSPEIKGEQRIEVQWDIFNVLNLLNKDWGHFDQDAQFENGPPPFLAVVGYDKVANRPIYNFTAPSQVTQTVYSPTQSRWRMQFGARYMF
jgi:outer membrane receptor protein involved in Fe transport